MNLNSPLRRTPRRTPSITAEYKFTRMRTHHTPTNRIDNRLPRIHLAHCTNTASRPHQCIQQRASRSANPTFVYIGLNQKAEASSPAHASRVERPFSAHRRRLNFRTKSTGASSGVVTAATERSEVGDSRCVQVETSEPL
jgi:hypothetical protein